MPESTLAAHPLLACELATRSVVCPAWRLRSAMAESSSGRLVIGLQMPVQFGQAHEQVPPVVNERDEAGHELAARQIAGGEACPAPLILQFVEGVFAVRPIAIELSERQNLLFKGSNEHAVFVDLALLPDLDEAERKLAVVIAPGHGHALLQPAAQDDHLALTAPAFQPQRFVPALPALAGIGPVASWKRSS